MTAARRLRTIEMKNKSTTSQEKHRREQINACNTTASVTKHTNIVPTKVFIVSGQQEYFSFVEKQARRGAAGAGQVGAFNLERAAGMRQGRAGGT